VNWLEDDDQQRHDCADCFVCQLRPLVHYSPKWYHSVVYVEQFAQLMIERYSPSIEIVVSHLIVVIHGLYELFVSVLTRSLSQPSGTTYEFLQKFPKARADARAIGEACQDHGSPPTKDAHAVYRKWRSHPRFCMETHSFFAT
jgi:hypothetical protein